MQVKTLVAHDNEYGVADGSANYHKKIGDIYEVPAADDAKVLINGDLVEKVDGGSQDRGSAGAGAGAKRAS